MYLQQQEQFLAVILNLRQECDHTLTDDKMIPKLPDNYSVKSDAYFWEVFSEINTQVQSGKDESQEWSQLTGPSFGR